MWLVTVMPIVFMALTGAVPIYFVRRYLKLRERQVAALEAARAAGGPQPLLEQENRNLRERVEQLEAIISSTDYELNRKLAALPTPSDPNQGGKS